MGNWSMFVERNVPFHDPINRGQIFNAVKKTIPLITARPLQSAGHQTRSPKHYI